MGFSVTAANVIIFIGLVASGSTLAATMLNTMDRVSDASREEWRIEQKGAHTQIEITSAVYTTAGGKKVTITVKNTGATVLDASGVTILADGVWWTIASTTVDGDSSQRVWPQDTSAVFVISVSSKPTKVAVSTENGVTKVATVT